MISAIYKIFAIKKEQETQIRIYKRRTWAEGFLHKRIIEKLYLSFLFSRNLWSEALLAIGKSVWWIKRAQNQIRNNRLR